MSYRDTLTTTRGVPRAAAGLLAQRGTARTDGLLAIAALALSATVTKFKTTAIARFAIGGLTFSKAATDNLVFSAGHTITKGGYGAVLVQIANDGTVSTKVVASPQAYPTALAARQATPAPDAGHVELGRLVIAANRVTDGLRAIATLAISATATKFKTTTPAAIVLSGVEADKAATDLLVFSAAHVVSATKFGVILVQMTAAGAISTKVPLATQAYADAPTALAALPAADAAHVALGYLTIHAGVGDFTANTTALTTIAGFVDAALSADHNFVCGTDDSTLVTIALHDAEPA